MFKSSCRILQFKIFEMFISHLFCFIVETVSELVQKMYWA